MKILYVGPTFRGSNATSWRDAFVELGHDVRSLDSNSLAPWPSRIDKRLLARVRMHPGRGSMERLNQAVQSAAREFVPDLTFFFQAKYITAATIAACRASGPAFVFMGDDMARAINRSPTHDEVIASVDCLVTSNSANVPEFKAAGVARVIYSPWAYDPQIHYPANLTPQDKPMYGCDIAFIGTFRPERADDLEKIVTACPQMNIRIWGSWQPMQRFHYRFPVCRWPRLRGAVTPAEIWCENYSRAIQSAGIVLGLLNHANRDLHTARSFEIPACGGFMLAERTPEHQIYFEEDEEAVYFGDTEEMIDKAKFYSENEPARRRIAAAGLRRCVSSAYRYTDRARTVLDVCGLAS